MTICELCSYNDAIGLFWVKDSHILSDKRTLMYLCYYCVRDLKRNRVRLELVKGIEIPKVRIPVKYPAEP